MQEFQLLLVQIQTLVAQLAFQLAATLGLALAWLAVLLRGQTAAAGWRGLFGLTARVALILGLLWLVVLAVAWPPLLERTGNVLGPIVAALVAIMLVTEALGQRLAQSRHAVWQPAAGLLSALGFSLAVVLALLALSWLHSPLGATLIDGRYQVTEFSAMLGSPWALQAVLATLFGALVLVAALPSGVPVSDSATILTLPEVWRRRVTGLGVAGLLGLLWLLARSVGAELNPVTRTTQTLYEALLSGSGHWALRATFVLWVLTLAGWAIGLGSTKASSGLGALVAKLPVYCAPLLWVLVCWQLFGESTLSELAGLPVVDLGSQQPPLALAFGLLLVVVVVALSVWLVWRFLCRLGQLAVGNHAVEAT